MTERFTHSPTMFVGVIDSRWVMVGVADRASLLAERRQREEVGAPPPPPDPSDFKGGVPRSEA